MKRIFIAVKIDPGETLLKMIADLKKSLKDESIKWTETGNIHVTLAFLGDTEDNLVSSVSNMLTGRCSGSGKFEFSVGGAGVFRSLRDPRIIWAGIGESEELLKLYEIIKQGLSDIGIVLEDRPFRPHLTIGRIRSIKNSEKLKAVTEKYNGIHLQKIPVSEVILYESILRPAGPLYVPLSKVTL